MEFEKKNLYFGSFQNTFLCFSVAEKHCLHVGGRLKSIENDTLLKNTPTSMEAG